MELMTKELLKRLPKMGATEKLKVRKGPERGSLYWVPDKDADAVLEFLARQ